MSKRTVRCVLRYTVGVLFLLLIASRAFSNPYFSPLAIESSALVTYNNDIRRALYASELTQRLSSPVSEAEIVEAGFVEVAFDATLSPFWPLGRDGKALLLVGESGFSDVSAPNSFSDVALSVLFPDDRGVLLSQKAEYNFTREKDRLALNFILLSVIPKTPVSQKDIEGALLLEYTYPNRSFSEKGVVIARMQDSFQIDPSCLILSGKFRIKRTDTLSEVIWTLPETVRSVIMMDDSGKVLYKEVVQGRLLLSSKESVSPDFQAEIFSFWAFDRPIFASGRSRLSEAGSESGDHAGCSAFSFSAVFTAVVLLPLLYKKRSVS